jgi:NAD dependent epimerase/dehydratase family enzyme
MTTIKIKGYITQTSWSEQLQLSSNDLGDNNEFTLTHRPIEVEIPISSLRFSPGDTTTRDKIMDAQRVKALELKKAKKCVEIEQIDQQIQELLALENFS